MCKLDNEVESGDGRLQTEGARTSPQKKKRRNSLAQALQTLSMIVRKRCQHSWVAVRGALQDWWRWMLGGKPQHTIDRKVFRHTSLYPPPSWPPPMPFRHLQPHRTTASPFRASPSSSTPSQMMWHLFGASVFHKSALAMPWDSTCPAAAGSRQGKSGFLQPNLSHVALASGLLRLTVLQTAFVSGSHIAIQNYMATHDTTFAWKNMANMHICHAACPAACGRLGVGCWCPTPTREGHPLGGIPLGPSPSWVPHCTDQVWGREIRLTHMLDWLSQLVVGEIRCYGWTDSIWGRSHNVEPSWPRTWHI